MAESDVLVTETHVSDAVLTIRLIKSFEYRTFKNVVLHNINLHETTPLQLAETIQEKLRTTPALKPFSNIVYDTFKVFHTAHGSKTSDLIVNRDHDDYILRNDASLWENGVRHESEISYFNRDLYEEYKRNPEIKKW